MRPRCSIILAVLCVLLACPAQADERNEEIARLRLLLEKRDKELADLKKLLDARNRDFTELEELARKVRQTDREEAARLKAALADAVAAGEAARRQAQLALTELREREAALQKRLADADRRNAELQVRLAEVQRELALSKAGVKPVEPVKPPPNNLEGTVREVKDNLVLIDVGADAGLAKGHELELFRMQPQPRYLGRVRILEVRAGEAVGQLVNVPSGIKVQVGDKVASRIRP